MLQSNVCGIIMLLDTYPSIHQYFCIIIIIMQGGIQFIKVTVKTFIMFKICLFQISSVQKISFHKKYEATQLFSALIIVINVINVTPKTVVMMLKQE